jgi:hypothetical protein
VLGLFLMESLSMRDPSSNELRKLVGWHRANGVEVEVTAIPFGRLRMKDVRSLHAKLAFQNVGNQRLR